MCENDSPEQAKESAANVQESESALENVVAEEFADSAERTETIPPKTFDAEAFRQLYKEYAENVKRQILSLKSKDKVIANLTAEVEKYREDFAFRLVKPFCVSLISYCEDCRKTLREIDAYAKDVPSVLKYAGFLQDDLLDLLANEGAELDGEDFYYEGALLFGDRACRKAPETDAEEVPQIAEEAALSDAPCENEAENEAQNEAQNDAEPDLLDLVKEGNLALIALLEERELRDKLLLSYEERVRKLDENYSDAIRLPFVRTLARAYIDLAQACTEIKAEINEDNKKELYASVIRLAIDAAESLLFQAGVRIEEDVSDTYDLKTNKLIKMIPTEDESLDKKVAFRHTNCYLYEGKVLYPSKVDVYKFVKN